MSSNVRTSSTLAYIQGEGRNQGTLFPEVLDDLVPDDHMCRVVDAFAGQLDMEKLGFGHPRLLLRGQADAHTVLSLAVMAYNLKRMANVLGISQLTRALQQN